MHNLLFATLRRSRTRLAGIGVLLLTPTAVALVATGAIDLEGSTDQRRPSIGAGRPGFGDFGNGLYCEGTPPPVGLLGRLRAGSTPESLISAGYKAISAIDGTEDDLFVLAPATGGVVSEANAESALAQLRSLPAVKSVGFILAQSEDPELRSCDYRLSDKPAAVEIAQRATAWMVANAVLTQSQFDAGGTTFQLAEDPTKPEHLFFTVLLAAPGGGIPGSENAGSLTSYVATIDKATGAILSAGRAHW